MNLDVASIDDPRRALEEEKQRALRLLAEFQNYRRRAERDHAAAAGRGGAAALRPILPVLETLEQALSAGSTDARFYEGVAATRRLFLEALREAGAEPVETIGAPFDPRVHEAVGTVPDDTVAPGTIVQEIRRGWCFGDELLRAAQVKVAAAPEENSDTWP